LTREQTRRSPEEDKLRNQSIQDVWDLHEASEVHLVYLLVDTESISFEKKQLEIKDGRLWIIEVEKNDTQGWRNQHELMSWKRRLDSLLEWMRCDPREAQTRCPTQKRSGRKRPRKFGCTGLI
jgi:hypothetical protein